MWLLSGLRLTEGGRGGGDQGGCGPGQDGREMVAVGEVGWGCGPLCLGWRIQVGALLSMAAPEQRDYEQILCGLGGCGKRVVLP